MPPSIAEYRVGLYCRLSRDDGDRPESDSIINQGHLLDAYCKAHPELTVIESYTDDGYTGTNFDRPDFQRMIADIEAGRINCVIVKDLSRFGRDYIEVGRYLERWFPTHNVRFIAVNDHVDSNNGPYDMMLPLKNVFNGQYAQDISNKVCGTLHSKQKLGEFIGAFACYGYEKDPADKHKLRIDPVAAAVVRRIFTLFEGGMGKIAIAKLLNQEGVPCPSQYKKQMGAKYHNGRRLEDTTYWTYATVDRILNNPMYAGDMVQGRSVRPAMHAKAKAVPKEDWTVVPNTHEAIIDREQWDRVQALLAKRGRTPDFEQNVGLFAGFLKCGDCGRAMAKTTRTYNGHTYITYGCGSHKRYGASICTPHTIRQEALEAVILDDLNRVISSVRDWAAIAEQASAQAQPSVSHSVDKLTLALERTRRLKKGTYEDYRDGLLSKADYLTYAEDYSAQEASLLRQIEELQKEDSSPLSNPWVERLLALGRLDNLDRQTLADTVKEIKVYEGGRVEITYLFSEDLAPLLESPAADTDAQ